MAYGCKRAGGFVDSNCLADCDCHETMKIQPPSPCPDCGKDLVDETEPHALDCSSHGSDDWKILPLEGKYYGTKIEGPGSITIKVWGYRLWELSERARDKHGPFNGPEDEAEWRSDGHYEDAGDLAIAKVHRGCAECGKVAATAHLTIPTRE